jgi:predicted transcriptional regulator
MRNKLYNPERIFVSGCTPFKQGFSFQKLIAMQHKGEIIKKAVLESGFSITRLANRLGKSRRTVYNLFDRQQVPMDLILEIGKIINHDFISEIKDLKKYKTGILETEENEEGYSIDYWKDKYYQLLEAHNEILKELTRKRKKQ